MLLCSYLGHLLHIIATLRPADVLSISTVLPSSICSHDVYLSPIFNTCHRGFQCFLYFLYIQYVFTDTKSNTLHFLNCLLCAVIDLRFISYLFHEKCGNFVSGNVTSALRVKYHLKNVKVTQKLSSEERKKMVFGFHVV